MSIKSRIMFATSMGMFGLAACTTPSTQPVTAAQVTPATKSADADGEMICKRQSVIGSNFDRKVCATAEQWEAAAEDGRRTTSDIQRSKAPGVTN